MTAPVRVQLRRTKGWRLPDGAISVARPTRWGNPFVVGQSYTISGTMLGFGAGFYSPEDQRRYDYQAPLRLTVEEAVALYEYDLRLGIRMSTREGRELNRALRELAGHDLACWCPLDRPCHADVLLKIANAR